VLIYLIGLQNCGAGKGEWNELHVVDVLRLRRSRISRGAPTLGIFAGERDYRLGERLPFATLRGNILASHVAAAEGSQPRVQQMEIVLMPRFRSTVWTSQLFVSDWLIVTSSHSR